jgi:hypothetical protein
VNDEARLSRNDSYHLKVDSIHSSESERGDNSVKASTALRTAVVAEWVLLISGVILSFMLESRLPQPLQAWLEQELEAPMEGVDVIVFAGFMLAISTMLVATVGFLLLQRWARWVYLAALASGYLVYPFSGPTVEHALADMADDLSLICCGFIIGLAFFSDALKGTGSSESPPDDDQI